MSSRPFKALLISAAVAVAILIGVIGSWWAQQALHRRQYDRVNAIVWRSSGSPPADVSANDWNHFIGGGPNNGLANFFAIPKYCPTESLRKMADQFEARWPNGAKSTDDIEQMMQLMEKSNPLAEGYGSFQQTRDYIKEVADGRAEREAKNRRK